MALTAIADRLRRKADEYKALGEEHAVGAAAKNGYLAIEAALREVADAFDEEGLEEAA